MTIASVIDASEAVDHAALAETMPLDEIDVSNPALYQQGVWQPYFRRLRREAPVNYCRTSPLGPYWSVTKHKDIIALEVDHRRFSSSSALGGITLRERSGDLELPMFIAMDPPKHDVQRKVVQPIVSPDNLANFEGLIRTRVRDTLDEPAARRNLQLGGQGFDRAHLPDAGHPVRLPVRGPAEAELLVGRLDRHPLSGRARRKRGAARGRLSRVPRLFHEFVERARQFRAAPRSHFHAGAWRGDPEHERARISRQHHPAHCRRQRHDAQFDERRPAVPEPEPG